MDPYDRIKYRKGSLFFTGSLPIFALATILDHLLFDVSILGIIILCVMSIFGFSSATIAMGRRTAVLRVRLLLGLLLGLFLGPLQSATVMTALVVILPVIPVPLDITLLVILALLLRPLATAVMTTAAVAPRARTGRAAGR